VNLWWQNFMFHGSRYRSAHSQNLICEKCKFDHQMFVVRQSGGLGVSGVRGSWLA
jgi:hypothetical protein